MTFQREEAILRGDKIAFFYRLLKFVYFHENLY